MKTKTKFFLLWAVLIFAAALVFFLGMPEDNAGVSIGYKKHLGYIPFFVAMENGYYEAEGLEVRSVVFDSTNQMLGAVVSGHIDAAIGAANLQTVYSMEEQSPGSIKIFNTVDIAKGNLFSCVMVKEGSGIHGLEDLEDASIGTMPGSFPPLWIEATIAIAGLGLEDITVMQIAPNLQLPALESGQVDALVTVEPVCTFGLNKGIGRIIYEEPLANFAKTFGSSVISAEFAGMNPWAAKRIMSATDKAIDFIQTNPEESMLIMAKWTGYKPELITGMKPPVYSKSDDINVEDLENVAEILYHKGVLDRRIDSRAMVYR